MEESAYRDRLIEAVHEEFVDYCKENHITTGDIESARLEELSEAFVERGFGVPVSDETEESKEKFK